MPDEGSAIDDSAHVEDPAGQPVAAQLRPDSAPRAGLGRSLAWIGLLTVVYLALAVPLLSRAPRKIMDESWEATTGWALAFEGRLRNPVIRNRYGIDRAFVQPRITQSLVLAASYKLLGFSLLSGRVASILVGLLAVLGTYSLMRTWLSCSAAGLIALLLACETQFVIFSRVVRPEIYLTCVSIWTLALLARGTVRRSMWLCLLAGMLGGIGCYTHPNMFIFALLGVVLIFCQMGFEPRTLAAALCYAAGGVLGVIPFFAWVAYAASVHDVGFFEQLGAWYTSEYEVSLGTLARMQFHRWWSYLRPIPRAPWIAILMLGGLFALIRRHPIQVWSLVLILGFGAILPMLNRSTSPRYLVVLAPWFAALVGMFVVQVWEVAGRAESLFRRRVLQVVAVGSVAGSLAIHVFGVGAVLYSHRNADYEAVCRRIAEHIPEGSRVHAPLVFWTGLRQYPYWSDMNEAQMSEADASRIFRDWYSEFDPEYLVRAADLCWTMGGLGPRNTEPDYAPYGPSGPALAIKAQEDEGFVRRRGRLVDEFTTHDFGRIRVYRIR